jgi:hypothetical protein
MEKPQNTDARNRAHIHYGMDEEKFQPWREKSPIPPAPFPEGKGEKNLCWQILPWIRQNLPAQ